MVWAYSKHRAARDNRTLTAQANREQPTRTGTGFPSPTTPNVPARDDMHPYASSVPVSATGRHKPDADMNLTS